MKHYVVVFITLSIILTGCPKNKVQLISKEFIIKGSSPVQKITVQVPENCEQWSNGVQANIDAAVKYAGQEASLKANFEKISIISQFSERLKAITNAQCKINQNSITIDPNESDQTIYNQMINSYVEYQKVADQAANLTTDQKATVVNELLDVYKSIYGLKKNELVNSVSDLIVSVKNDNLENNSIVVFRNDQEILRKKSDSDRIDITLKNDQIVPEPDEVLEFKFEIVSQNGNLIKNKKYQLSELLGTSSNGKVEVTLE